MSIHAESDRLARAIANCVAHAAGWAGDLYRSASPRYANRDDLLTGADSKLVGARWNPPSSFHTVYASLDPHTALDEALAHFVHFGLPLAQAMPRVLVALKARLRYVLDLTQGSIRRLLGVSEQRLSMNRGANVNDKATKP
jgi:RES domain-containing protein